MRLYFDTNIYGFIDSCNEVLPVKQFLVRSGHKARASSTNLFELYAIRDPKKQLSKTKTLVNVASEFERKPESWVHAYELRREIVRCRPEWVRSGVKFTKKVDQFLKGHLRNWENAKALNLPPAYAFSAYSRDFEGGVSIGRDIQKTLRSIIRGGVDQAQFVHKKGDVQNTVNVDINDPEMYWRVDCAMVWFNAMVTRHPASRDYADWLDPYLKNDAFKDSTYGKFWLEDVEAENTPLNRLTGLVGFYQLKHRITHGNFMDQLHANNLVSADVFLTADRAFYKVLMEVTGHHFPNAARPVLINKNAPSALEEIRRCLEEL